MKSGSSYLTDPPSTQAAHQISQDIYQGDYNAHGQRNGKGHLKIADGTIYEGTFNNGVICGIGKLTEGTSGDVYEGEFFEGKKHGLGKETYKASGDTYEGEYS